MHKHLNKLSGKTSIQRDPAIFFPARSRGDNKPCNRADNLLEWEVSVGRKYYPVLHTLPEDPLQHNNLHQKNARRWGGGR